MNRFIIIICVFFSSIATATLSAQTLGPSGQPLPRFVSIKGSKANMRTGPGRQYPIKWTYQRRLLPLEVIDEHGPWRKVRDHENITGWMHVVLLSGKRTAMIRGKTRTLYRDNTTGSPVLLTAEPGVIGEVVECQAIWCQLEIDNSDAWIEKRHIWGVYSHEEID